MAAPTGLSATAATSQVALSWSTVTGATGYNVKRSLSSGGTYATVASPAGTAYTNTGLTNGTTYYYVVSAVNSTGESSNSSQVTGTPMAAPTGVSGTAGTGQVVLSWSSVTGATSYNVKRSLTSGGTYANVQTGVTASAYTNTGLTNGTTYYYVVSAVNATGESSNSSQVTGTPMAAPTGLGATGGDQQVALSWNSVTGATSYTVKRSVTSGETYANVQTGVTATAYTNTGLTNGTTYYYVVSAVNSTGESSNSSQASATPGNPPSAPAGLKAVPGDAQVILTWTSSQGATSYNVKRSLSSGGTYATVQSGVTSTGFTNTGLTNGTTYYYVVSAVNSGGESSNSDQVNAKPRVPKAISFDGSNDYVDVPDTSWGDTNWSVECWIKGTATDAYFVWNSSKSDLRISSGKGYFQYDTGTNYTIAGTTTISNNNWHHVVGVRSANTIYIYVDGSQENSASISGSTHVPGFKAIGAQVGNAYYSGSIDEVRCYNKALTSSDVSDHYNSGTGQWGRSDESGLVAGWHFDEGSGTSAADYSGNSKDGTLTNGPSWVAGKVP
jgi:fibronectin type 3 domain-containing protein